MNFPIEPELITEQIAADASNRDKTALQKIEDYVANGFSTAPWYGQATGTGSTKPVYFGDDLLCVVSGNGTAYRSELAVGPRVTGFLERGYYMRRKGLLAFDMTLSESMFELADDLSQYNIIFQLFPVTENTASFMSGPAMSIALRPGKQAWTRLRVQTGENTGAIVNYPGDIFDLTPGRHQFSVWYDMDAGFVRVYVDGSKVSDVNAADYSGSWGYTADNIYANNYKIGIYSPQVLASDSRSEGIHPERSVTIHGTQYLSYSRTWPVGASYNIADFSELEWADDDGGVRDNDIISVKENVSTSLTLQNAVSVNGDAIVTASGGYALDLNSNVDCDISGLTLSGGSTHVFNMSGTGPSFQLNAVADGLTVQDGTASNTVSGIYINGSDATVKNCTVQDVNNRGIEPRGNRTLITGNFLQRCSGGVTGAGSIQVDGTNGTDVVCAFNTIDRTDLTAGYCFYGNAAGGVPKITDNLCIRNNVNTFGSNSVATDPTDFSRNETIGMGFGLWVTSGGTGSTLTANSVRDFARHGLFAQGANSEHHNNTVDASNGQYGIRCNATTGTVIKNNIFVGGSAYGILAEATSTASHNCSHGFSFGAISGVTDANLITDDPLLIDPTNGNLHIDTNSPCVRAGTKWWSSQADQPQGQNGLRFPLSASGQPDMGAYPVREDAGYARKAYALSIGVMEVGVDIVKARTI